MDTASMTSEQAASIVSSVTASGIDCWVMGGWGVDALLGRQTRTHHDLDLVVNVAHLPALDGWLESNSFVTLYSWEEDAPIERDGSRYRTAFVAGHSDGRELDIHAVVVHSPPRMATEDPWSLPDNTLSGRGAINGVPVACVSRDAQLAMHQGYTLPEHHATDLRRLGLHE